MRNSLLLLLMASVILHAQTVTELLAQKTAEHIGTIARQLDGVLGYYVIDLNTGYAFGSHEDTVFPTASSIKVPILIELFRAERAGKLRFIDTISLTAKDTVGGSGVLQKQLAKGPFSVTVRELTEQMIETSDNLATNQCIRLVGMESVNQLLTQLGFSSTRLQRVMMDESAARQGRENISTPRELARIMEKIYRHEVVDGRACDEMIAILKRVDAGLRAAVPSSVEVAAKPGELDGVRCEVGIVFLKGRPFILSVMSAFLSRGENPVGPVAREVYDLFARLAQANQYGRQLP